MSTSIELTSQDLLQEVLIVEVEKHEELYNPLAMHMDSKSEEASWQEVSSEVNLTVPEAKRLWHSLRDRYLRERKKDSKPNWYLYDVIDFLEPYLQHRSTTEHKDLEENGFVIDNDTDDVNTPSTSSAIGRTQPYSLKAKTNGVSRSKRVSHSPSTGEESETAFFLNFVGKQLDRLSVAERSSCYLDIMQVINKYTQASTR